MCVGLGLGFGGEVSQLCDTGPKECSPDAKPLTDMSRDIAGLLIVKREGR